MSEVSTLTPIRTEDQRISCEDGYSLAATVFHPADSPRAAIMFGPATGIKRQFYAGLASHLAELGYAAVTFDNRGIGDSLEGSIAKSEASLRDWGYLDMTAVLEHLKQTFPGTNYHLLGHSAGGQLVGLMHNARDLKSMFNFACSSGRLANLRMPFKIRGRFFMNLFIPFSNAVFGYTKSPWFGMGENLPRTVAAEWNEWCSGQGYVKTVFGKTVHEHLYDELDFPSMWLNASDDDIAMNENVEDMISVFAKLPSERIELHPSDHGLNEIGHMKFFSRKSKVLWKLAEDWFEKHS